MSIDRRELLKVIILMEYIYETRCRRCFFHDVCWGEHGLNEHIIEKVCRYEMRNIIRKYLDLYSRLGKLPIAELTLSELDVVCRVLRSLRRT